ncbi:MAG: HD family hydrolase [Desulfurococcales archaeon]|nr:HD family hydrolase [Desulfurococcales archaeon]
MKGLVDLLDSLNSLVRTGWMLRGVPPSITESVSEHSYNAALIALILGLHAKNKGLDIDPYKVAVIALIHDIGEGYIGDISKTARIDECKSKAERRAIEDSLLPRHIKELYYEFENKKSIEALLAKISEQLATLIKAYKYKLLGFRVDDIIKSMTNSIDDTLRDLGEAGKIIRPHVDSIINEAASN